MPTVSDVTRAQIVLLGMADTSCFTDMQQFIEALPKLIGVEIPQGITNVIVSNVQPNDSQTTDIWFRLSNSGSFLSINVFSQGAWRDIYPVNTNNTLQIFWFHGDPTDPPPGWTTTTDAAGIDPTIAAALAAEWIVGAGGVTYYSAIFTGF